MIYGTPTRGLGGVGGRQVIERDLCAADAEFCDDRCERTYIAWADANQEKESCLTDEQRRFIIATCKSALNQTISIAERNALLSPVLNDPCRLACQQQVRTWAAENPGDASCVGTDKAEVLVDMCLAWKSGQIDQQRLRDGLATMIQDGCPPVVTVAQPSPPPAVAAPAVPAPQVPAPVTPEDAVYTPSAPVTQPIRRSALRTWGPVVGALLIVGGGIYLLR